MTKEDLSKEQIYYRLLDISIKGKTKENVAYKVEDTKKHKRTEKNCNYCAKHHKGQNKWHTYHIFPRAKNNREK